MARAAESTRRPAEVPTTDEALALIRACSRRGSSGIRNAALIAVMWRSGLRIGEALALLPRDIDQKAGTLRVRHGKGDKARTVGLDGQTIALLDRWLDRRHQLGLNRRHPLFCTLRGGVLDQGYVRNALWRLADRTGVDRKRAHPHALRHAFAAGMVRDATSMPVIRDALGHSSLAVTDRYLRDVAPAEVIKAMRGREWEV